MITVQQAADKLRISTRTVLRWIGSGKLEATKQRACWQVKKSSVDALVAEETRSNTQNKNTDAQSVSGKSGSSLLPGEEEFISWITCKKQERDKRQP